MPVKKRWSKAGPVAAANAFICSGVNMPGIIGMGFMSMWSMPAISIPAMSIELCSEIGRPRSVSHCFMNLISSVCEMLMRLPNAWTSLSWLRVRNRSVISTACEWCMIMPCINLMSAYEGFRGVALAVSGVRVLLLWPGAPGCTMDTPLGAVFASWHGAKGGACESTAALNNKNLNDMVVVSSNPSLWESVIVAVTKQPWCKTHISYFIKKLNKAVTVLLR